MCIDADDFSWPERARVPLKPPSPAWASAFSGLNANRRRHHRPRSHHRDTSRQSQKSNRPLWEVGNSRDSSPNNPGMYKLRKGIQVKWRPGHEVPTEPCGQMFVQDISSSSGASVNMWLPWILHLWKVLNKLDNKRLRKFYSSGNIMEWEWKGAD